MNGDHAHTLTNARCCVLLNDKGQHSLWPVDLATPAGWRRVFDGNNRAECRDFVARCPVQRDSDVKSVTVPSQPQPSIQPQTLHGYVARWAADTPNALAIISVNERVTYANLSSRVDTLASAITRYVKPGSVVAIELPRDASLVVAVLAVLSAGAAYTMLDPQLPAERRERVCQSADVRVIITTVPNAMDSSRIVIAPDLNGSNSPRPMHFVDDGRNPAALMFTSGSTGEPKGVLTSHEAIIATLVGQSFADFGYDRVWLQCSPVSWDAFALELFGALLHGACCVLQPGHQPEPAEIINLVHREQVDTVYFSSGLLNVLIDNWFDLFTTLRQVMTGGEPPSTRHLERLMRGYPDITVINGYSPLENTIFTLTHRVSLSDCHQTNIPVGRPLNNKRAYNLDAAYRQLSPGVEGEVHMAGLGLAVGYLSDPAQTADRFIADPFGPPGERMYRTGDIGVTGEDGLITLHGRADRQLKIRGHRVEPAEVEAALIRWSSVRRAHVQLYEVAPHSQRLCAWVVVDGPFDATELRRALCGQLPDYLIPTAFVQLSDLPLTGAGKVDTLALPAPAEAGATREPEPSRRDDSVISLVSAMAEERLGLQVGPDDNLLEIGADSLMLMALLGRVRHKWGVQLRASRLFPDATPRAIAELIEGGLRKQHYEGKTQVPHV